VVSAVLGHDGDHQLNRIVVVVVVGCRDRA
jgi:hypothetical protein